MAEPLSFEALRPIGVSIDNPWIEEQAESLFLLALLRVSPVTMKN
jgi:hypothetical protein